MVNFYYYFFGANIDMKIGANLYVGLNAPSTYPWHYWIVPQTCFVWVLFLNFKPFYHLMTLDKEDSNQTTPISCSTHNSSQINKTINIFVFSYTIISSRMNVFVWSDTTTHELLNCITKTRLLPILPSNRQARWQAKTKRNQKVNEYLSIMWTSTKEKILQR